MKTDQIRQLITLGTFPEDSPTRELIETHISWIILLENLAFKIKKPLKFSFLDFSSLADRRHFCYRELRLNRRLAPEMYQQVLPVRYDGKAYHIGDGEGEVVDYALEMRRMDNNRQMDRLLSADMVTADHIAQIALQLAQFHKTAAPQRTPLEATALWDDFSDLQKAEEQIVALCGADARKTLAESMQAAQQFLTQNAQAIAQRSLDGWVIDGHGDLHTGNIFLLDEPVIFDCIEFSDRMRYVDVLDELGFLTMDIEFHGYPDLAGQLIEAYQKRNPCIHTATDRQLLTFYKCYRANVRLKVLLLRMEQVPTEQLSPKEIEKVCAYLSLIKTYAQGLQP
jgi:aminoglycoside phosphotransferase family enzyme